MFRFKELDFLEMIKLVNYIRHEVQNGNASPIPSSKAIFEGDQYLLPVLEDDALLYSLHDIVGDSLDEDMIPEPLESDFSNGEQRNTEVVHFAECRKNLQRVQTELEATKKTLEARQRMLQTYKNLMPKSSLGVHEDESAVPDEAPKSSKSLVNSEDVDSGYFAAYATYGPFP